MNEQTTPWHHTPLPPGAFKDRVVLVTGASGAIGGAIARHLGALGATLVLLGKTPCKLEKTYDAIVAAGGPEPLMQPVNFEGAVLDDYAELAGAVEGTCGRLDALVLAAATRGQSTPVELADPLEFARTMHVDLSAPFLLTQYCLPLLARSDAARVLALGDRGPAAYGGAYVLAKAALERMIETLAHERDDLLANVLDPGPTRSELRARAFPGELPEQNPGPEHMLPAAEYLLGPQCAVTGRTFRLAEQEQTP
ncbi:MAG: SDR family NAD(P)-dependent oxidoreductase [Halothiobacillaceae bacterium]